MTENKEKIIVNDVDVSGCRHCIAGDSNHDVLCVYNMDVFKCPRKPNCYYKQLQRIRAHYKSDMEKRDHEIRTLQKVLKKLNATIRFKNELCKNLEDELEESYKIIFEKK